MISIDRLFTRTNNDLARKGKSGYNSTDEFNRDVNDVQNEYCGILIGLIDSVGSVMNSLSPFVKEKPIIVNSAGHADFPKDYRKWLDVSPFLIVDDVPDMVTRIPGDYMPAGSEYLTVTSPIRGPKPEGNKITYAIDANGIKVYGAESNRVWLKYISQPPAAMRGFTVNNSTQREELDASTTVDLIWKPEDEINIRNLLLRLKGLEIQDTNLINWLNGQSGR